MWPSSLKKPVGRFLWLAFASGVLVTYYSQIWTVFKLGPEQWVRNNLSLSTALRPFWRLFKSRGIAMNLPAFSEAMQRNLLAIWGAALVLLCAGILGTLVLRLLSPPFQDWREVLLYRASAGLGILSYLCLGLAILSQYRPATVHPLVAVITAGGVAWLIYNRLFLHESRGPKPRPGKIDLGSKWDRVWLVISLLAILTALVGALAPETEFDALRYHLWLPKLWLEKGSPVDLVNEYVALYPLTWELLFGTALVIGNAVAPKLLHFTTLPLTSLLVYQLARRFVPKASPWLSVALFVTVPSVLWEATTAYNDLTLAFYVGLAIYALLQYHSARRWQWLALAALNMGFALATKNLALIVLLPASVGLAWLLWLEERSWRKSLMPVAVFVGISLLIPLPWYLRSWLASGNPVFPDLYHTFGAFPAERWNDITERGLAAFKDGFGYPRTPLNLILLPWNLTIHAARFGGSLGPIFLVLIPGVLRHQFRTAPVSWLLGLVGGYTLLWASPVSSFQMRFLVPITPLLAILASLAFAGFVQQFTRTSWQRALALTAITGLLLLNFPPFTSLHETDRSTWQGWLTHTIHELPFSVVVGAESGEAYLGRKVPSYQAWQYINHNLPPDALVLTFSDGDHYYSERQRLWSQSPLGGSILEEAAGGNGEEAIQDLRQIGVGYVLFDKRQTDGADHGVSNLRAAGQATASLELLYEDRLFVLYRID